MTELIEPMNDVSPVRQVEARFRGTGGHAPTFTEVVYAHHRWWRARQSGMPDPAVDAAYDAVLTAFEARHGRIVLAYRCSEVESAVAPTERKQWGGLLSPLFGFHRESDWATKTAPTVASELVVACASHLLSRSAAS